MKIAYVTPYDAQDVKGWSGTGYFIAKSLQNQAVSLEYIGPLQDKLSCRFVRKFKRHYHELFGKRYLKDPEPLILKNFSRQITKKLSKTEVDIILSATTNPIAYLNCTQPIVFWADATFANVIDFYPQYSNLCEETVRNWHYMERLALQKCKLAIFSSEWAAQSATQFYNTSETKVRVIPFGANIHTKRNLSEVKALIDSRASNCCKLLFLGVDWYRKGGDVALKVVKELNKLGLKTELTIVGCQPIVTESLPNFVKSLGFISKSTLDGQAKISQLIAESHFLILPSLADCTPIVLSEANSLGVPCLTSNVGGIPTIIKNHVNGFTFNLTASALEYCEYVLATFVNYSKYRELALSSFNAYESRLNWDVSAKKLKKLLTDL